MGCIDENYVQHTITYNCGRGNNEIVASESERAV